MKTIPNFHPFPSLRVLALIVVSTTASLHAQFIDPVFAGSYTLTDLGSVPDVPPLYGGLTLKAGDTNTLLLGGNANAGTGALYSIGVTRDFDGHITGFTGSASFFADAAYNDGGVAYGPGGVLFLPRWPVNELGQTKPGSTITDKIIDLAPFGVASSAASLAFVPGGHNGAGLLKLVSWSGGEWYTLGIAPDGSGTYDVTSVTYNTSIGGGPEGIAYVPLSSPLFVNPSVLVAEYSAGKVAAYETDANGDPILATRRTLVDGLSGAEGAFIDPVTGDFLFSTFGGGNKVVRVSGFSVPPPVNTPDGATSFLLLAFSSGLLLVFRVRGVSR